MPGWTTIPFTVAERLEAFFSKIVVRESGCHEFVGATNPDGYGNFWDEGICKKAHRFAWEAFFGPIPEGKKVLHDCDNPPCCNPWHLYLGTDADNSRDKVERGRMSPTHGANNPAATTLEHEVREILGWIQYTTVSQQWVADKYRLSKGHINNIKAGRVWPHIHRESRNVLFTD